MLISSANDSAETIKDGIDGKYHQPIFIKAMNEKAQQLGLKDSRFTNACGFDSPGHFSSVEDLAVLSHYAITNYPLIAQIVKINEQDLTAGFDSGTSPKVKN